MLTIIEIPVLEFWVTLLSSYGRQSRIKFVFVIRVGRKLTFLLSNIC